MRRDSSTFPMPVPTETRDAVACASIGASLHVLGAVEDRVLPGAPWPRRAFRLAHLLGFTSLKIPPRPGWRRPRSAAPGSKTRRSAWRWLIGHRPQAASATAAASRHLVGLDQDHHSGGSQEVHRGELPPSSRAGSQSIELGAKGAWSPQCARRRGAVKTRPGSQQTAVANMADTENHRPLPSPPSAAPPLATTCTCSGCTAVTSNVSFAAHPTEEMEDATWGNLRGQGAQARFLLSPFPSPVGCGAVRPATQ